MSREEEVLKKFRTSRAKTTMAVQFLLVLVLVPLLTQQLSKHLIVRPIVDRLSGEESAQVFLNSEMKEEAFKELQTYEESLKFDALIHVSSPVIGEAKPEKPAAETEKPAAETEKPAAETEKPVEQAEAKSEKPAVESEKPAEKTIEPTAAEREKAAAERERLVQEKAIEIAEQFRGKSRDAVSNVFADIIATGAFVLILLMNRTQIAVLKSFMDDLVFGLSDSAKAFILILTTDIFVGFHSPHGWEVLLEGIAGHLGVAANASMISLFIATVPVIMDTVLKYWIFRYMSRMSPSTVATYRGMNE
jgi:CemA family